MKYLNFFMFQIHLVIHHTLSVVSVSLSEEEVRGWLEVSTNVSNWAGLYVGNSSYKDKNSINMSLFLRYSGAAHNWAQLSQLPFYQRTVLQQWMSFCFYLGYRIINAYLFIHGMGEFICLDFKLHMIKTWNVFLHYANQLTQMRACCLKQVYLSVVYPLLRDGGVIWVKFFL